MIQRWLHLRLRLLILLAALLALVLALAVAWRAAAQATGTGQWTSLGDLGGMPGTALARDGGRLYAGSYYGGLFVADDDGAAWRNPLPAAVATVLIAPDALYAGTWGGGVFRSRNSAATWSPANAGLAAHDVYALALDPALPSTVYAGTEQGVFKTTDGGEHWLAASTGLAARTVFALAFLGDALYAGTDNGAFVTSNGGDNWTAANLGLRAGKVLSLAAGGGKLYAGTDRTVQAWHSGGAWISPPLGSPPGPIAALAVAPSDGRLVVAGGVNGVYLSANGGITWQAYNTGLAGYSLEVAGLALDASQVPPLLYAATGAGVWRTPLEPQEQPSLDLPLIMR